QMRLVPASPDLFDTFLHLPIMDTTRVRTELGWSPRYTATETLEEFLRALRQGTGGETPPLRPSSSTGRLSEVLTAGTRVWPRTSRPCPEQLRRPAGPGELELPAIEAGHVLLLVRVRPTQHVELGDGRHRHAQVGRVRGQLRDLVPVLVHAQQHAVAPPRGFEPHFPAHPPVLPPAQCGRTQEDEFARAQHVVPPRRTNPFCAGASTPAKLQPEPLSPRGATGWAGTSTTAGTPGTSPCSPLTTPDTTRSPDQTSWANRTSRSSFRSGCGNPGGKTVPG